MFAPRKVSQVWGSPSCSQFYIPVKHLLIWNGLELDVDGAMLDLVTAPNSVVDLESLIIPRVS